MNKQDTPPGFCSAPWMEAIAYADGELKACDRCVVSFGNWQKEGLENVWRGDRLQKFRAEMREGRYPHEDCRSCHNNGTQRTAASSLRSAYFVHQSYIRKHFGMLPGIEALPQAFFQNTRTDSSDELIATFFQTLNQLVTEHGPSHPDPGFGKAIAKLRVIGETLEDYLSGVLVPRRVATFRQAQLQAKCTARCVMCAGKFTGEIVDGPTMDSEFMGEAFAAKDDITDFWCNGAEYLFYKDWKKVALMLVEEGVKMRLSTNGILLTEDTIRFLVDNRVLDLLTVSMDAASKGMLESIRVNVKFDALMDRLRFLFRYAKQKNYYFQFNAAFVMMRRNLHELPDFIRNMRVLAGEDFAPPLTVLCQPLENFSVPSYRSFVHLEHHSLLGEENLRSIFEAACSAERESRVTVRFYNQTLAEFIDAGMPFPAFFPKEMDAGLFPDSLRSWIAQNGEELLSRLWLVSDGDQEGFRVLLMEHWRISFSPVAEPIFQKFPELRRTAERILEASANEALERRMKHS